MTVVFILDVQLSL